MKFNCSYCGCEGEKSTSHYNRAIKTSPNLYCSQTCFGLDRRKSVEEKKRVKSVYDKKLRQDPVYVEKRKAMAHEWFKLHYAANPEMYRKRRQDKYPKHLEYLRTPEYKAWKKDYDERFLANKHYGDFAEAAIALKRIEAELESQAIKLANGITFNKSTQQRKRK